jgi:hypothetical protein
LNRQLLIKNLQIYHYISLFMESYSFLAGQQAVNPLQKPLVHYPEHDETTSHCRIIIIILILILFIHLLLLSRIIFSSCS